MAGKTSERTKIRRQPKRGSHDRDVIDSILDEGVVCHVGFVADEQPYVIPMAYARDGNRLLLHGSTASRLMRTLAGGAPAVVTVTLLDAIVLARSAFHHSMNYRSVVALGRARPIEDESEKRTALDQLVEHLVPGRTRDARAANDQELKATLVLEFPLDEASAKQRFGPPIDDPVDLDLDVWAGVLPYRLVAGEPKPDEHTNASTPRPAYLDRLRYHHGR